MSRSTALLAWSLLTLAPFAAPTAEQPAATEVANERAERYHELLRKRPNPGAVFERFYDAWMTTGTVDGLQAHLDARAEDSVADRCIYAFFLTRIGDDLEALRQFEAIAASGEATPEIRYQQARSAARLLDFEGAIVALDHGLEQASGALGEKMAKLRGRLLIRTGRREEGLAQWQALAQSRPDDEDLQDDLLASLVEEGLFTEAAQRCEAVIEAAEDPYRKAVVGLRLGDILDRDGKRDEAVATYAGLLSAVGVDSWLEKEILAQIDRVFRRDDDLDGLARQLETLIEAEPQRSALRRRHAQVLIAQDRTDEALESFRAVLAHHPGRADLRAEYADMLLRSERPAEAAAVIAELTERPGADPNLLMQLADLRHQAGEDEAAVDAITRFLEHGDDSVFLHLRAARSLEGFGLAAEAEAIYQRMLERHAGDAEATLAWAGFLHAHERGEEAVAVLTRLAADADLDLVLRIAQELQQQEAGEAAYALLEERLATAGDHAGLLDAHSALALQLERPDEALASARRRLYLSRTAPELERALDQVITAARRAQAAAALRQELVQADRLGIHDRCLLAELHALDGRMPAAAELLAPEEGLAVEQREMLISTHVDLLKTRHDWTGAARVLERLVADPAGRSPVRLRELAELHQRRGDGEAALRWITEWKRIATADHQPWLMEARIHRDRFDHPEAVSSLKAAAVRFPDQQDIRIALAEAFEASGRSDDAHRVYRQLYEQTEDLQQRLGWVRRLAELAEAEGTTDELVARFRERREGNRSSVAPLLALAEIHAVAHDYPARREVLLEATRLRPDDVVLLQEIARIEAETGEWESALETLRRAEDVAADPNTRRRIARLYLDHGFEEEGMRLIGDLATAGGDPRGIESLASSLAAQFAWDRCAEVLATGLEHHDDDYRLAYLAAIADEERGENRAAIERFLALLEVEREIQVGPAAGHNQNFNAGWLGLMRDVLPPMTLTFFEQVWSAHLAYSYQQQHRGYMPSSMMGAAGGGPTVPGSLAQLQAFALTHLGVLRRSLDEDAAAALSERVERSGVPYAAIRLQVDQDDEGPWLEELREERWNDDPVIQALLLIYGLHQETEELDSERAGELHAMFAEDYPLLAMIAADAGGRDQLALASAQALVDAGIPGDGAVMMLIQYLERQPEADDDDEAVAADGEAAAGEAASALLREAMTGWYPEVARRAAATPGPYGSRIVENLLQVVLKDADLETCIAFINREVATFRADPPSTATGGSMMPWMRHRHGQQDLLARLPLPPQRFETLPKDLLDHAIGTAGRDQLVEHIDRIEAPLLRAYILSLEGDHEAAAGHLQPLLEAEAPSLDAMLFAAALAAEAGEAERFTRLIGAARFLPMPRDQRRKIDAAQVHLALETDHQPTLEAGRAAALRLRQNQLVAEQRFQLVDAMSQLGLTEEAQALEEEATAVVMAPNPAAHAMAAANPRDQVERIGTMAERGKGEAAVTLALRLVRQWATVDLKPGFSGGSNNGWQQRQLREVLERHALTETLVERSAKGAEANWRRSAEHARLLVYLERFEEALTLHEALIAERPDDRIMPTLHAILLLRLDPERAHQAILERDQEDRNQVLGAWMDAVDQTSGHDETDLLFAVARVAIQMAGSEGGSELEPTPLKRVVGNLTEYLSVSGSRSNLRQLYSEDGLEQIREGGHSVVTERVELHDELCRALLAHPLLAPDALSRLDYLGTQLERDDLATLRQRAEAIMLDHVAAQAAATNPNPHTFYHHSGNRHPGRFRSPLEIAVVEAWEQEQLAELSAGLLAELRAVEDQGWADELERLIALYACDEAGFAAAAEAYTASLDPEETQGVWPLYDAPWITDRSTAVIACARRRGIAIDLAQEALDEAERLVSSQMGWSNEPLPLAQTWLAELVENQGPEAAIAFIDRLDRVLLGEGEERARTLADVKRQVAQRNFNNDRGMRAAMQLAATLQAAGTEHPAVAVEALRRIAALGISEFTGSAWELARSIRDPINEAEAEATIQILVASDLLEDPDRFADLEVDHLNEDSLLHHVAQVARRQSGFRAELVTALAALPSAERFGNQLLRGVLDDDATLVLDVIGRHREALDGVEPERLESLFDLLAEHVELPEEAALAEDATSAAGLAWFREHIGSARERRIETVLAAEEWSDLDGGLGGFDQLAGALAPMVVDQPERVDEVLARIDQLYQRAVRRSQFHAQFSDGSSIVGELVKELLEQRDDHPMRAYVLTRLRAGDGPVIPLARDLRRHLARNLIERGQLETAIIDAQTVAYADAGFEGDWTGLLPVFIDLHQRLDPSQRSAAAETGAAAEPGGLAWTLGLGAALHAQHLNPAWLDAATGLVAPDEDGNVVPGGERERRWRAEFLGAITLHAPETALVDQSVLAERAMALIEAGDTTPGARAGAIRAWRLSHPGDQGTARALAAARAELQRRSREQRISARRSTNRGYSEGDRERLDLELVRAGYAGGDRVLARRVLSQSGSLEEEIAAWRAMIEAGDHAAATAAITAELDDLEREIDPGQWDEALAQALATYLETVADPGLRQAIETVFIVLEGPDHETRTQRIRSFAERLDLAALGDSERRAFVHRQLMWHGDGAAIRPLTAAAAAEVDLDVALHQDESAIEPLKTHLAACLQAGDEEAEEIVERVLTAARAESGRWERAGDLLDIYDDWMRRRDWRGRDAAVLARALTIGRAIQLAALELDEPHRAHHNSDIIILGLIAGGAEEVRRWSAELAAQHPDVDQLARKRHTPHWHRLREGLVRATLGDQAPLPERRLELLDGLLDLGPEAGQVKPDAELFEDLIADGLASWDELYTLCDDGYGAYAEAALRHRERNLGGADQREELVRVLGLLTQGPQATAQLPALIHLRHRQVKLLLALERAEEATMILDPDRPFGLEGERLEGWHQALAAGHQVFVAADRLRRQTLGLEPAETAEPDEQQQEDTP